LACCGRISHGANVQVGDVTHVDGAEGEPGNGRHGPIHHALDGGGDPLIADDPPVAHPLEAALRDRLAIGVRLSERRRHYRASSTGIDRVEVLANDPYAAVVRVRATDRAGLLYDIARAMAESGLEIRSMTATTKHDTADDVFRVTDSNGQVPEEGLLGMLRMRLRELG